MTRAGIAIAITADAVLWLLIALAVWAPETRPTIAALVVAACLAALIVRFADPVDDIHYPMAPDAGDAEERAKGGAR